MNFKRLKNDLGKRIEAKKEEIKLLDTQIAQLQEKHQKIKLDPFGTRKKKLQAKIEELTQVHNAQTEELDLLNNELAKVLAEEQRQIDNKRFFRGDANKPTPAKILIRIFSITASVVAVFFAGLFLKKQLDKNKAIEARKIEIGFYSENLKGKSFDSISAELQEKGFTNISPVVIEDIDSTINAYKNNLITDVNIEGDTSFIPTDKYLPEDEITITYHVLTPSVIAEIEAKKKAEEEARLLKEAQREEELKEEQARREEREAELREKAEEKERKEAERQAAAEEARKKALEEEKARAEAEAKKEQQATVPATSPKQTPSGYSPTDSTDRVADEYEYTVYITKTGKRYHQDPDCGGPNSTPTTISVARSRGLTPCQKCAQ